ncbi:hypothetical protein, variant 1 [Exophiala xenobiotica]|uniref:Aminoglycoside phosphotransferase domain-containing protein n=2 Tax=Exophiala xenobiotica TaxID=348802 RepID=A0A0D2C2B0_9EURO|nr:hypothetical protein, variant 1 [Exophiala xenobiotica]XP_013319522.1 uncharacterized protein PV05_03428 [Exophiala xenobiotica]KIW58936.1 hypothetical protein PV05_03428 [Exophiala xenobiotica]KIW58937.1 hypothetical protein, variant 1 [Exophiala xenobiotica]
MLRILGLRLSTDRYIEKTQGQMLLHTWNERHQERDFRKNLFQGLSRILLNIARVPLPRIGSFTVNDDGSLLLANRPLSVVVQQLENEQIPVDIPRHLTYTSVDSYVIDILNCLHDSRLRHQPNGASDKSDCIYQMSALAAMKAVSSLFLRRDLCHGPFLFNLTDLHQSNIFVDEIWNITCLIDLEWALSSPIEMIYPPRWLANQDINQMDEEIYDPVRQEFMDILEHTEQELSIQPHQRLSPVTKQAWEMGMFWYTLARRSPMGLVRVFYDHIQPILASWHEENSEFYTIMLEYWTINSIPFIDQNLADKEDYDRQLRQAFEDKADETLEDAP